MIREPRIRIHLFLVLGLLFASGCQVARMELDPALANVGAMRVNGVELFNGGRVWIAPSLSQIDQDRAAVIVTTLLLFQPLEPPANT